MNDNYFEFFILFFQKFKSYVFSFSCLYSYVFVSTEFDVKERLIFS